MTKYQLSWCIIDTKTPQCGEKRKEKTSLLITSTQAKAIRRKQADKKLTAKQAGEEIGVTQVTYRKIRDGGEVKPSIYQKAMQWLAEDY